MKVCFFHLMPYRDLPADFELRCESSFVTPPNRELQEPDLIGRYYNAGLDELLFAARLGFDGVCVNEHHQNVYGLMASPNLVAAVLARETAGLGTAIVVLGNTLPNYPRPLRSAEELAMIDCLSGGRLVAGFVVGTAQDVVFNYGVPPTEARGRFFEAHDLIRLAWTRPGPFAFNGRYTQLRYVNPWPLPVQQPHPPIWTAGGGSIETWDFANRFDYCHSYLSFFGAELAATHMDAFWEQAERAGHDRNPYRAGFLQLICVSESDGRAEADYAEHVRYFYAKGLRQPSYFANPPGYVTRQSSAAALARRPQALQGGQLDTSWRALTESGMVFAGSPTTVRDRLLESCKRLNIGHLLCLLQIGSMPTELVEQNVSLFAEGVLPSLRGLWEGWEDRWWPANATR